ncbi:hypothetical protein AS4_20510 [Acinetobacter guillouiae]|nr:hypothetical protein AS4_20510 [Acinetobacter guillouiae]
MNHSYKIPTAVDAQPAEFSKYTLYSLGQPLKYLYDFDIQDNFLVNPHLSFN